MRRVCLNRYTQLICISLIAFLILPLLFICVPAPATGNGEHFVKTYANAATGSNSYNGSSATYTGGLNGPKETIGAAINAATNWGSVYVAPGTYNERITLDNGKSLIGSGALTTTIDAGGTGCAVTVTGNSIIMYVTVTGGAPSGSYSGGGVYVGNECLAHLTECVITGNYRGPGSGDSAGQGGGICSYNANVDLVRCTVNGNSADYQGGGLANICTESGSEYGKMYLTNCTISGNSVTDPTSVGGGLYNSYNADVTLLNVTIANNSATGSSSAGGGFSNSSLSSMYFKNCIVANNTATISQYNNGYNGLGSGVNSQGNNLSSDNSCFFNHPSDQVNTNPYLGPLQNNGGQTLTCAIITASPAYNRGDRSAAPATDQRGVARPAGTFCSIGAYEPYPDTRMASAATNIGNVIFTINAGSISPVTWVQPVNMNCPAPNGFILPYGMFSFNITSLLPGASVQVTLKFANPLPLGIKYCKCINGSMVDCTSLVTRIDPYTLQLNLTDGSLGDADGVANGTIVDPGGPAFPLNTPQSSSAQLPVTSQQAPVSLSNISVKSASLSASQVAPGERVIVTANVANTGTGNGTSLIHIYVNGQEDASRGITVNSGGTSTITFDVARNQPGTYTVYVGGVNAGSFTVDQFTPDTMLFISGALVFFAFILGIIYIARRRTG